MQFFRRLRFAADPSLGTASWHAPERPGYDATLGATLDRIRPMLASEPVVWLSTVRPDGLPHLIPTWFWWDGTALLVWSKPEAVKVRNVRANARVMVALGRPEDNFAVGLIEARARLSPSAAPPDAFFAKYAGQLADGGLDRTSFEATYTQQIRIVPTRFLAWRGRGRGHDPAPLSVPPNNALLPAWA